MDSAPPLDPGHSKGSVLWRREHGEESGDRAAPPAQDEPRPIRRVRSPSRPRGAWPTSYKPRDEHSFYKNHRYFHPRAHFPRRDHFLPKWHHAAPREREPEKERYEQRDGADGGVLPPNLSRCFLRSTSSREDSHFAVDHSDRNPSRVKEHRTRSRDSEPLSKAAARDRAIQQKRREIDEVYYQECEVFGVVSKLLISKDPSLEVSIQSSLQENLRDIGSRCVEAMEKFIEDYDSQDAPH